MSTRKTPEQFPEIQENEVLFLIESQKDEEGLQRFTQFWLAQYPDYRHSRNRSQVFYANVKQHMKLREEQGKTVRIITRY